MSGLVAIFGYGPDAPPVPIGQLERICDSLAQRGADSTGTWVSEDRRVGLAEKRVAIVDVTETGAQPMATADTLFRIVFTGALSNHLELRRRLKQLGYQFTSTSDTEVILHLYVEFGERLVDYIRGMYAFAIWDSRRGSLFVARDPFGIKPLYYSDDGTSVVISSQVKALLRGGVDGGDVDAAGHVGFFLLGCVPEPFTFYSNIRALPAGNYIWVGKRGVGGPTPYCSVSSLFRSRDDCLGKSMAIDEYLDPAASLNDAVKHHLVSDVPVAILLSSSVYSTALAALAAAHSPRHVELVTLRFKECGDVNVDETPLTRLTAASLGLPLHVVDFTKRDISELIPTFLSEMDQPTSEGLNTFLAGSAVAKCGLKVALSGVGGHVIFGDYPSYTRIPKLVSNSRRIGLSGDRGARVRKILLPILSKCLSPKLAALAEYSATIQQAYFLHRAVYFPWELDRFLDPKFVQEGLERLQLVSALGMSTEDWMTGRQAIACLEACWYMRNQLLRDAECAGTANGIEIRAPYVDVDLYRRIGPALGNESSELSKQALFSACVGRVTKEIGKKKKTSFSTPPRTWLIPGEKTVEREPSLRGWAQVVYHAYRKSNWTETRPTSFNRTKVLHDWMPLVSVITPSYNQGRFIEETIRSVLAQSYPSVEYIVIDGGSNDNSVEVIRRFESHIAYWCSERDGGQADAINKGFRKANGVIVGWINSDDYLEPDAIEKLVFRYRRNPSAVLFHGRLRMVNEEGLHTRFARDQGRPMTFDKLLNGIDQLSQPGSFYRRAILEKVGYLDRNLHMLMDHELWLKLLKCGHAEYLEAVLANYRIHSTTKTLTRPRQYLAEMQQIQRRYGGRKLSARGLVIALAMTKSVIDRWM